MFDTVIDYIFRRICICNCTDLEFPPLNHFQKVSSGVWFFHAVHLHKYIVPDTIFIKNIWYFYWYSLKTFFDVSYFKQVKNLRKTFSFGTKTKFWTKCEEKLTVNTGTKYWYCEQQFVDGISSANVNFIYGILQFLF